MSQAEEQQAEEQGRPAGALLLEDEAGGEPFTVPEQLPVLPLKNTVLFPKLLVPMLVNTRRSKTLIDAVMERSPRLLVAVGVRRPVEKGPGPDDMYRIGTVLNVVRNMRFPDGSYRVLAQCLARAEILDIESEQPFFEGRIALCSEGGDEGSVEAQALVRDVREQFLSLMNETKLGKEVEAPESALEEPGALADLVAYKLEIEPAAKQAALEELDVVKRLHRVRSELKRVVEAAQIAGEIREKVQSEMGRSQREYMMRQQLDQIRRELGEKEDSKSEAQRFRERIEALHMPEEAYKQAVREVERFEQIPDSAMEHSVIRNYLEWMTEVPWSAVSEDRLAVDAARAVLDEDHYDLDKVKERIIEYIAVLSLKRDLRGPILCFVGPPGTGKTSLGKSIARALGRRFERIALGGVHDEAEIRGHRRTYIGALPGRIIQGLRRAGTRNPVFMLDEIDKVGADYRGDPSSALLEVLDPEQNNSFSDHYLETPFDLSQVLFIATANLADPIQPALRDRMELIELPGYIEEDKLEIARRYLLPRQLRASGIAELPLEVPDPTLQKIIRSYTREAGVRNLEREIGAVCRKIARRVAEGEIEAPAVVAPAPSSGAPGAPESSESSEALAPPGASELSESSEESPASAASESSAARPGAEGPPLRVAPEDLDKLLGPVKFEPELAERAGISGVAVGLAWTPAGGDILFVESTRMPGRGELRLTGSLGEVMRESAEAARSWLKHHAERLGLAPELFESCDLHIHVPAGAVPKDGPSAGIAMVVALASLLSGRTVPPDTAMTGEITLRGKVLPVGGIKEKVLAARRAGIRRVVLPEPNRRDAEQIEPELVKGLQFDYVSRVDEALEHILPSAPR